MKTRKKKRALGRGLASMPNVPPRKPRQSPPKDCFDERFFGTASEPAAVVPNFDQREPVVFRGQLCVVVSNTLHTLHTGRFTQYRLEVDLVSRNDDINT